MVYTRRLASGAGATTTPRPNLDMSRPAALEDTCLQHCLVGNALDGMCVGMVVTNGAGRVVWMNRSAQHTLGLDRTESQGLPLAKVLRDPQMAEFWHEVSAKDETALGEVSLHWPRACELKVNSSRCLDAAGECIGRVVLFCDVTSEHTLQIQLSKQTSQRLMELAEQWQGSGESSPQAGLTAQELRVLRLVGSGLGNDEIAQAIHVAPSTVRTHLKHAYAKLGLTSRAEAISYAIRAGLV